jgi:hypothetical protein
MERLCVFDALLPRLRLMPFGSCGEPFDVHCLFDVMLEPTAITLSRFQFQLQFAEVSDPGPGVRLGRDSPTPVFV